MSHPHCKYLVGRCMDFRLGLPSAVSKYLEQKGIFAGDYDLVSLAGGIKTLTDPENPSDRELYLKQIGISSAKHNAEELFLFNHTDCAAYEPFASAEIEERHHIEGSEKAKKIILEKHPSLKINLVLVIVTPLGDSWEFAFKEV